MNIINEKKYYYSKLNLTDQGIYNKIYDGLCRKLPTIALNEIKLLSPDYCMKILEAVLCDNPKIFYVNTKRIEIQKSLFSASLNLNYLYNTRRIDELSIKLENEAKAIVNSIISDRLTDYEKELKIHDYLMNNIQYNMKALSNPSDYESYTAIGVLLNKNGVCESFARGAKLLFDIAGLDSIVVIGTAKNFLGSGSIGHAWNIVKINGYYHHIDVTWDNTIKASSGITRYDYFNLSDDSINSDHVWTKDMVPLCKDEPYNYFQSINAVISNKRVLENFIKENLLNEEKEFSFRVNKTDRFATEVSGILGECVNNALAKCRNFSSCNYIYSHNENQNVWSLKFV